MNHALRNDVIGGFQRAFDVAFARGEPVSDIVAEPFMNHRAALRRCFDIDGCRQLFIVDRN